MRKDSAILNPSQTMMFDGLPNSTDDVNDADGAESPADAAATKKARKNKEQ